MESLSRILVAGLVAAGLPACSPSPLDQGEPNAARPGSVPAVTSGPAGPAVATEGAAAAPAVASEAPIPQYRRSPTPAGGVETDIGLKGRVRIREGCIKVVDDAGQEVLPIFPTGARWTVPGREIRVGDLTVGDGQAVVWSVQGSERDFRRGRAPGEGEQDVPAHCTASRYVRVLL